MVSNTHWKTRKISLKPYLKGKPSKDVYLQITVCFLVLFEHLTLDSYFEHRENLIESTCGYEVSLLSIAHCRNRSLLIEMVLNKHNF